MTTLGRSPLFAVQDDDGNIVDGATITVTGEITGAPAVVYSDKAGTISLGSSYVAADGGNPGFYAVGGLYKVVMTKAGFSRTLRDLAVGTAQAADVGVINGGTGVRLVFDDATAAADPGSGVFRANSATFASITALYIDNESFGSHSITDWLDSLDDGGTSVHRGFLRFENAASPLQWAEFNVTGSVVDSTGYRTITVTPRAQVAWPFTDSDLFSTTMSRTGISGANGVNGTSALTVVRCVSRTNVTIASGLEQGDTVDGVSLTAGDLVLLAGQTAAAENGVYVAVGAGAGAASRHTSFDTYNENPGACFSVLEGTTNGRSIWQCTSATGGTIGVTALTFANRLFHRVGMTNGSIVASRSGNAETYAVKTLRGADPSADDPVYFTFDDGAGSLVTRVVAAALSVTISSGSTMGATNADAFRIWIIAGDDAGTVRLGAINCSTATRTFPLLEDVAASSTAEGGAGGADTAGLIYSTTAFTSKYTVILGHADYESGLATAGTWVTAPDRVVLHGPGKKKPGDVVQTVSVATASNTATTSSTLQNTNVAASITPKSTINLVRGAVAGTLQLGGTNARATLQTVRGATSVGPNLLIGPFSGSAASNPSAAVNSSIHILFMDAPRSVASTTYTVKLNSSDNVTSVSFPTTSGGVICLDEIMG